MIKIERKIIEGFNEYGYLGLLLRFENKTKKIRNLENKKEHLQEGKDLGNMSINEKNLMLYT